MSRRQYDKVAQRLAFANCTVEGTTDQVPAVGEEGFTVRLGDKWHELYHRLGVEHVVVLRADGKPVCEAHINYALHIRLEDIQSSQMPKGIYNRDALKAVLSEAYKRAISPDTFVTVLHYTTF